LVGPAGADRRDPRLTALRKPNGGPVCRTAIALIPGIA